MEVITIKHYKTFYTGVVLGCITTIVYAFNKSKKYDKEQLIKAKVNNAKMTFNKSEVYGHWIMKKNRQWIGAINIKKDNKIIEHPFIINNKYQLFWQED